ncbi:MAG: MFS transporter [Gammaproteobacteria bacterium]|nr:MFS transporter [Gammaproteobacteria bacterium]MDH3371845.1 MFS transporter [Gammaproteobacteria bacterium]
MTRREWKDILATAVGLNIGWGSLSYVALTIGIYVEGYGMTLAEAGAYGSAELVSMTATAWVAALAFARSLGARVAILGALITGIGNILTAFADSETAILLSRLLAGGGAGVVAATINASVARSADPVRVFARANLGVIILATAFFLGMPWVAATMGYPAYFVAYGVFLTAGTPLMVWLRESEGTTIDALYGQDKFRRKPARAWVYLVAVFLLWLAYGIVFSFSERLGVSIGMKQTTVGTVIAVATFLGVIGSGIASRLGTTFGPTRSFVAGVLGLGLCFAGVTYATTALHYIVAMCLFGVVLFFALPFVVELGARLDKAGRTASMVGGTLPMATAVSPLAGSWLIGAFGFRGAGITCLGVAAVVAAATPLFTKPNEAVGAASKDS